MSVLVIRAELTRGGLLLSPIYPVTRAVEFSPGWKGFEVGPFASCEEAEGYIQARRNEQPFLTDWFWWHDTPAVRKRLEKGTL